MVAQWSAGAFFGWQDFPCHVGFHDPRWVEQVDQLELLAVVEHSRDEE